MANTVTDPNGKDWDLPDGITQDRANQFLKDNPGDYVRLYSALVDDDAKGGKKEAAGGGSPGGGLGDWAKMLPQPIQAFTEQFQAPQRSALSTTPWGGGNFQAPQLKDIGDWTKSFTAPTAQDMYNDPSYQFRVNEGRKNLQASAAANGTLYTGGTLDSIMRQGQDYASQEWGNIYDRTASNYMNDFNVFNTNRNSAEAQNQDTYGRALQTFGTNYGLFGNERNYANQIDDSNYSKAMQEYMNRFNVFETNQTNAYNSQLQNMNTLFGVDSNLWNRGFSQDQLALQAELGRGNLGIQQQGLGLQQQQIDLSKVLGLGQLDLSKTLGLGNLNQNQQQINEAGRVNSFNMFNTMDQSYLNNLFRVADYGYGATGNLGNMGSNISDLLTGIGNVYGAGKIGSGNAWNAAMGNIGNNVASQAQLSQLLRGSMYGGNNPGNTGIYGGNNNNGISSGWSF